MTNNMHFTLGSAAGLMLAAKYAHSGPEACAIILPCIIGSVYPDIDLPASQPGRIIKPLSYMINRIFGHRKFIHSLPCLLLASYLLHIAALVTAYPKLIVGGFVLGYFLHLLQDSCTRNGIMWLYPIPLKVSLTRVSSKSTMCWFITIILMMAVLMATVTDCPERAIIFLENFAKFLHLNLRLNFMDL